MERFMAATERIPLLVTPAQKALFARKAKASKLTVNEFVRRAAEAYDPSDNDEALIRLVAQVKQTTHEATTALDAALKACAESNRRIAGMEAAHAARNTQ
jgi:phage shock protein A